MEVLLDFHVIIDEQDMGHASVLWNAPYIPAVSFRASA